ncbi:MEDS: MEthanogen/methylotroph, DcmR Sensory domain [Nitrosomonas sp. Nm166]|nr:MEDS: MEthanogen/methylotroph, DcmR Sensory domain [Nitrosomonas sp. Nm166]
MNQTRQLTNSSGNHTVQICLNESSQVDLVTGYIKDGLLNEEAVIVIAKPALRQILKSKMDALCFDGQFLKDQDQIKFFDAEFLLSNLISDGILEEKVFQEYVAAPIYNAQSNYKKARAFGEMVDILWKQDQHDMAIQLEGFWKNLTSTQELTFLCTYSLDKLDPDSYDNALEHICKYHSHLAPQEDSYSIEPGMGGVMLSVFGEAWNRVISKFSDSQKISTQIQSTPTIT